MKLNISFEGITCEGPPSIELDDNALILELFQKIKQVYNISCKISISCPKKYKEWQLRCDNGSKLSSQNIVDGDTILVKPKDSKVGKPAYYDKAFMLKRLKQARVAVKGQKLLTRRKTDAYKKIVDEMRPNKVTADSLEILARKNRAAIEVEPEAEIIEIKDEPEEETAMNSETESKLNQKQICVLS